MLIMKILSNNSEPNVSIALSLVFIKQEDVTVHYSGNPGYVVGLPLVSGMRTVEYPSNWSSFFPGLFFLQGMHNQNKSQRTDVFLNIYLHWDCPQHRAQRHLVSSPERRGPRLSTGITPALPCPVRCGLCVRLHTEARHSHAQPWSPRIHICIGTVNMWCLVLLQTGGCCQLLPGL